MKTKVLYTVTLWIQGGHYMLSLRRKRNTTSIIIGRVWHPWHLLNRNPTSMIAHSQLAALRCLGAIITRIGKFAEKARSMTLRRKQ